PTWFPDSPCNQRTSSNIVGLGSFWSLCVRTCMAASANYGIPRESESLSLRQQPLFLQLLPIGFHEIHEQGLHRLPLNGGLDLGLHYGVAGDFPEVRDPRLVSVLPFCHRAYCSKGASANQHHLTPEHHMMYIHPSKEVIGMKMVRLNIQVPEPIKTK